MIRHYINKIKYSLINKLRIRFMRHQKRVGFIAYLKHYLYKKQSYEINKFYYLKKKEIKMAYFALRCFPEKAKYIIIALNVIVAIMGVVHWAFAGTQGTIKNYYVKTNVSDPSLVKLFDSPIAYFAIAGIFQIAVSIFAILMLLEIIGGTNKIWWVRALIILLVFQFAFNFCIAVYTSMMANYFNSSYAKYLDYSLDYISQITDQDYKGFVRAVRDLVKLSIAEAIIGWLISIPSITIILLGLTDQLVNDNTVQQMGKLIPVQGGAPKNTIQVNPISMNDSLHQGGTNTNIQAIKQ